MGAAAYRERSRETPFHNRCLATYDRPLFKGSPLGYTPNGAQGAERVA